MHFNSFLILTSLSKLQCRVDGVFYLTETISLHWNIFLKFIYIAIQFGYTFVDLCTWRQKPKPHISEFRHFNKQYSIMKSKKYFSIGSKGTFSQDLNFLNYLYVRALVWPYVKNISAFEEDWVTKNPISRHSLDMLV